MDKKRKKNTYSEQVVQHIKRMLLAGQLVPGQQIKEQELSEKLGVSRAPVREAIQILAQQGLVTVHPKKSKYITALTSQEIRDSYFTGGVLEGAAVAQALASYSEKDLRQLEELVDKMYEMAQLPEAKDHLATLDDQFHKIMFSRLGNKILVQLCYRSSREISKFLLFRYWFTLYTPQEIYDRHRVLIDTMRSGNPEAVEREIRSHYQETGERMSRYGCDKIDFSEDLPK